MELSKVSKAVAGALAGLLIAALAKYNVVLDLETSAAVATLLNAAVAAVLGFATVYFAPKNK